MTGAATASEPAALVATDVVHAFGGAAPVRALDGVDLEVPAGACVALVGESGSGKTTLLRCFNRMVNPQQGTITLGGREVRAGSVEALRRGIGYVPQDGGLLPHWTVRRNVEMVPRLLGMDDVAARSDEALALAGLPPTAYGSRFPHELSGGQQQRVALARAIAARPPAILLDEPFGALDAISRADLQTAFEGVRRATGATTLLVTHDLAEAARLADSLIVMRAGRVEQRGTFSEVRHSPSTPYVQALVERTLAGLIRLQEVR
ncbi:MAG: ATP-binding cassette domain-containing protein [Gemmatimonadaceae bacterium]|nr:ATP-binding cassette domain-containing protein [Geodermatophilaceae bacterium]MBA3670615.1 ATP-binding cassette domain-containing protein [Gemmatimonadaceae bacterium]